MAKDNQWNFVDDESEACDAMLAPPPARSANGHAERMWQFQVLMNDDMAAGEKLAVVGNCDSLGNWQLSGAILMSKDDEDSNVWSVDIPLPRDRTIAYRYFVCAVDPTSEKLLVRRWETSLALRQIAIDEPGPRRVDPDIFGVVNDVTKVDRGWLSTETIVQFKIFNAPFSWKQRMKKRLMFVKVTPMNLRIPTGAATDNNLLAGSIAPLEDSLSNDTHDTRENGGDCGLAFSFSEVVTLSADDSVIKPQPQFGVRCGPDDLVIFHLTIGDFENTAYLIDLYTYSSKAEEDEPPHHLGYHYVLPNLFKMSEGRLEVPITCASKHRPMGMMQLGYLLIKPTPSLNLDMSVSYTRYWNKKWSGLDVGHRGSGTSFKTNDMSIRENTITSLKNAAAQGADMVEFDVQLSKDLVPVVYHDFMIYVSLKSKCKMEEHDFLALPVRELTLQQLKNLKVYHTTEGKSRASRSFQDEDLQEHQPFPPLADVLDAIDPHVGFNIEVKWSQRLHDGTMEEEFEHIIDRNLYVDCILDVVFRKAGKRRVVFSCFDPDICTMLRFKQNRYPVMFLTIGVTEKYQKYLDPRGNRIETAVFNSLAMELLGIVAHTEDLLRDPSQVNLAKERGLVVFCWGDDNNCKDTIKLLKNLGLHAIIYDKMDVLTSKEIKQSVFLLQAKESQNELLKLQALEMGKVWHTTSSPSSSSSSSSSPN
ncbi:glycerophosphocholine phosphodiesterase GPCPD1 [Musca vetustissima]|uniref:glycerophosphocholine phosphodiesterase GPCPD1 n=1 Tax=Musca vetustissima TaxID=27455 RepID=UPI002AB70A96|nr:glycerophosphocholine phosphodiesterase GPCPD1 [Musca vetustissima]